ncbi:MAG: ribonuclease R, partial [Clostridiaceae bacterium]|nr:ribonuclease R [Clostridiaceae bacterium]
KPYERREGGEGGSFERKPYERRESGSFERKPYERREGGEGGSFERKPYERREGGSFERKPYERREGGEGGSFERKPYERREGGEGGSFERKPYERREGGERGSYSSRPSYGGERSGRSAPRTGGFGGGSGRSYDKKPGGGRPYEGGRGRSGGDFQSKPVGVYEESELITGTLKGNRKGFAFLLREGGDIFIPHSNLRGAMHGDIVKAGITDGDAGEVVEIVERGIKKLAGTFKKGRGGGFVIPDDNSYFTDIYVPADKQKNAKNDLKVVVKIIEYPDSGNPIGEITELLGESGTVEGDITALIRAAGFRENFSTAQVAEAEMASNEPVTLGSRTDFRKLNVITIDGDDAKDFDDAVSVEELPDGGYRLWVHIADVASFVAEGSVLDKEALKRATSVYLPNMVLPMLPEAVSNGCCSLVEGEDRYVLTAIMTLDAGGHVTGSEIAEGVICSAARMTYGNVDKILNGDPDLCNKYKKIKGMLAAMKKLADILNVNRIERGSVEFMSDEAKITVENDKVISVEKYNLGVSNGIIEEFMLLANETVARYMEAEELPFVYRIHGKPDPEKLAGVKELFKNSGVKVMVGNTPKDVQTLLDSIKGEPQEKLLNKVTLRAMQKAKYLGDNTGHFGLALTHYSHFTSPIRRYPDLLCHRLIKNRLHSDGSIDMDISDRWRSIVDERSEISSEREAAAAKLERDANDYFKALFMEDKIGEEYDAEISGVTSFGVFAELPNTVEGLVKISSLAADSYEFSEKEFALKGRKNIYTLGDPIKVRLTGVSISERQCYFEVVE